MVEGTKKRLPVMLSDTTDPYLPLEAKYGVTGRCVEVLAKNGFPLLIVTKSDLVTRDIDIFKQTRTVVTMTITTLNEDIARIIEPHAPSPEARFDALRKIIDAGIPTVVRIDPVIPTVNSQKRELEAVIAKAAEIGVKQITSSTMKIACGLLPILKRERPSLFKRLTESYEDGEWIAGYKYLNKEKRMKILKDLRALVLKYRLEFATCREGFPDLNTVICDGTSWCRAFPCFY
jgi:DNA repair photolyase